MINFLVYFHWVDWVCKRFLIYLIYNIPLCFLYVSSRDTFLKFLQRWSENISVFSHETAQVWIWSSELNLEQYKRAAPPSQSSENNKNIPKRISVWNTKLWTINIIAVWNNEGFSFSKLNMTYGSSSKMVAEEMRFGFCVAASLTYDVKECVCVCSCSADCLAVCAVCSGCWLSLFWFY